MQTLQRFTGARLGSMCNGIGVLPWPARLMPHTTFIFSRLFAALFRFFFARLCA
jgi:hypothetical protein